MAAEHSDVNVATAVPSVPVDWNEDNVKDLGITFAPVSDNTSEFTRSEIRSKIPQRYFDVKMTFTWHGEESQYLRVDDAVVPYVPPPTHTKGARGSNTARYGAKYVYASLPKVLLDHIVNEAAVHGYRVHPGEPRMPSTEEDWWVTLNIAKNSKVRMERKRGEGHKDASLSRIFLASKMGVTANVILSLKLKCGLDEVAKDDGTYYDFDEDSPVTPGDDQEWNIGSSMAVMTISDVGIDVPPPQRVGRASASVPANFATTEADAGSDELAAKLKAFGI
jgi:hypothetical protein